jgi:hypothetical protein
VDLRIAYSLLASFSAYSPALPPIINSSILELFRGATDPQRPLGGVEREQLERNFEISLRVLHQFAQNSPHDRAVALVETIRLRQLPFALYLRSFDLGARPAGAPTEISTGVNAGMSEQTYVVRMEDHRFQRVLQERIVPTIAVLAVENETFEFHIEGDLPRLRLSGVMWPYVVRKLIDSAAMILLFLQNITPGVEMELSMLRSAKRQAKTVIITATLDESKDQLRDFPVFVRWDEGEQPQRELINVVMGMGPYSNHADLDLESQLLPPRPLLPAVRDGAEALVDLALTEAGREMQQNGSNIVAHDALVAAIAASLWSQKVLARGVAYKRLAMLQLEQGKVDFARLNMARFLDIVESQSRDSGKDLAPVLAGLERLVQTLEGVDRNEPTAVRFRLLERKANS